MKRLLTAFVLSFCFIAGFSQSAENRYNSRMTRDGVLFFIMPEKLKDLSGLKRFEYDVTLLSWTDSATVNFTFESESLALPSDLEIKYADGTINCDSYTPLFVDIKRNHYEIRITSKFSISQIESIFSSITPPVFCFTQEGASKSASYKPKAWTSDRKKLNDIFKLYTLSR